MYFWQRKMGFGIAMKKCGLRDSRGKGAGMRDQDPPFQTLSQGNCTSITLMRLRRIIAFNFDCRFFMLEVFNSNNLLSEVVVGLKLFYPKSFRRKFCAFLKAPNFK